MRLFKSVSIAALILVFTLLRGSAVAQTVVWIGNPTLGEFVSANLQLAAQQFSEARRDFAEFESQIAAARRAYFTASPANRAAAGEQFGALLYKKDMMIGMPRMMMRDSRNVALVQGMTQLANRGKALDGGVAPNATKAFSNWIDAVSSNAGTSFGGAMVNLNNLRPAILAPDSMKAYEIYRGIRDRTEKEDWDAVSAGKPRQRDLPSRPISLGEKQAINAKAYEMKLACNIAFSAASKAGEKMDSAVPKWRACLLEAEKDEVN